ncbi:hypothetical protein GCM10009838_34780 [Catenulispora subtropica]|uniref:Uncharacterized protein n=2 Tax=Catenulispora subtropica TaxID=450798 RepID=A0ABN2RPE2_9ACTN
MGRGTKGVVFVNWFMLLWGAAALAHGAALAANLRGYADKCMRLLTGGLDRQPVQHFNAAQRQWRRGRAGAVPDVGMLRAVGGVLAVGGAAVLLQGLGAFSAL